MTTPAMYARREPSGLVALRQTRHAAQLAVGKEHPHDVCAVARDLAELRAMCAPYWPDADYSALERDALHAAAVAALALLLDPDASPAEADIVTAQLRAALNPTE